MHSWRVLLLPFLDQQLLYNRYNFSESWDGPNNRKLAGEMPRTYIFTDRHEPGATVTGYLVVRGSKTGWPADRSITYKDLSDGADTTIAMVENHGAGVHWMSPHDLDFDTMSFELGSPNGVSAPENVDPVISLFDGSVRVLHKEYCTPETLRAMLTRDGGEVFVDGELQGSSAIEDGRDRVIPPPKKE